MESSLDILHQKMDYLLMQIDKEKANSSNWEEKKVPDEAKELIYMYEGATFGYMAPQHARTVEKYQTKLRRMFEKHEEHAVAETGMVGLMKAALANKEDVKAGVDNTPSGITGNQHNMHGKDHGAHHMSAKEKSAISARAA